MNSYIGYEKYKQQKILTAAPGELILMLYDGCIKQLKLSISYIDQKDYEKANNSLIKGQEIITELIKSLDLKYDLSHELYNLYDFSLNELFIGNIKKDSQRIENVISIFENLKEVWQEIVAKNRVSARA